MKDNKKVNIGVTGFGGSKLADALLSRGLNMLSVTFGNTKTPEDSPVVYTATNVDYMGRQHYTINHRVLERNKYAPWGRGLLGGKAAG